MLPSSEPIDYKEYFSFTFYNISQVMPDLQLQPLHHMIYIMQNNMQRVKQSAVHFFFSLIFLILHISEL